MEQDLEIRVLGTLEVVVNGRPVDMPPSKKTRALLAYLALTARAQRRERLCEIFWDLPDDPKGALRWSLSKIRRILNSGASDRIASDRSSIALDLTGIDIDWIALRRADQAGFATLGTDQLEALAAKLRGTFLEDLSLPRCPDFEAWRFAEATQVEAAAARLLRLLTDRLRDVPERAVRHALQLRRYLPDDEAVDLLIAELQRAGATAHAAFPPAASVAAHKTTPAAPEPPAAPSVATRDLRQLREISFCNAPDGTRIAWNAAGEGPAILRAGHWMSHLHADLDLPFWRHWLIGLSERNRLIRFDLRGNGLSDWDVPDLSFETMVSDLEAVADACGSRRFTLLGISQGCAVAIAYAVRYPDRVAGLVLYGGYARGWRRRGNPSEIAQREAIAVLMREGWGQENPIFQSVLASMFLPRGTDQQGAWFIELQRSTVSPENAWRLQNALGDVDVTDLLGRVTVPTIVLHPTGDAVSAIHLGRELAQRIPGARIIELDTCNHIMMEGEPAFTKFLAEVQTFAAAADSTRRTARPREVRRTVTVLEADLISPLQSFDGLDAEILARALRPVIDAASNALAALGGLVLEASEAGFTAAFGAREASEIHAVQAARAALALQAEVDRASQGRVRLRVALDSGEAIVTAGGSRDREISGPVLRQARRLTHALRRAGIAMTDRTRKSAGGYIRVEPMHRNEHPGFLAEQPVHELLGLISALSRWHLRANSRLTRFVGRRAEFDLLNQLWRHVGEGRGQVVVVIAEPGIGKSRFTHEFLNLRASDDCLIVEAGALEFDRDVAHVVVKRILRSLLAIGEAEGIRGAGEKLARALERHGADAALETPLAAALDLPPDEPDWELLPSETRVKRICDALHELLARAARETPLVVLVEDVHWIDRESRMAVERLIEGIDRQRILLILTCRPEFRHTWGARSSVHTLRLHPLSIEEAEALVLALVGSHPSVSTLRRLLVERTDGTPLCIEETVHALEESRRIVGGTGGYVAPRPIIDIETVSSVEPVIAARIDRLAPRERELLQAAAVIGRTAPHGLLTRLSGLEAAEVAAAIATLERAEFLFRVVGFPEPEYTFRHALIQDVAYSSLMREDRKRLHAAAMTGIEQLCAGNLADHAQELAKHAYRAELWEPAAKYLALAAERAIDRSAYRPATLNLERAIESLAVLPETPERIALAIDVRSQLRLAYMVTGNYGGAVIRLKEARDLAERVGDVRRQLQVLLHLSFLHSIFGRLEKAIRAADSARAIAVHHGLDRYVAEADLAAAQTLLLRADARGALARLGCYFEKFTTEFRTERFGFLVTRAVWYLGNLAQAHALVGEFGTAMRHADEAETLADETRRPLDRYAAQYFRNLCQCLRGPSDAELDRMEQVATECLERAPFPFSPRLLATWGYAQMQVGRTEAAERTLERALEASRTVNMLHFANVTRGLLALVRALRGDPAAGGELAWAARRAEKDGDEWQRIRVLEVLAEIEPDAATAARHLETAARIAGQAGFRPIEARVLVAMARRGRGERTATELLARAAGMFEDMGLADEAAAARGLIPPEPA